MRNSISTFSTENSLVDTGAVADIPMYYANDLNKLKRALDRKHKTIDYLQLTEEL